MNSEIDILKAENANLKQVNENLRTVVLTQLCDERDEAIYQYDNTLIENKYLIRLVDEMRGDMSEESRAKEYVKHIVPYVDAGRDPSGYDIFTVSYNKDRHIPNRWNNVIIGYSWIEAANYVVNHLEEFKEI